MRSRTPSARGMSPSAVIDSLRVCGISYVLMCMYVCYNRPTIPPPTPLIRHMCDVLVHHSMKTEVRSYERCVCVVCGVCTDTHLSVRVVRGGHSTADELCAHVHALAPDPQTPHRLLPDHLRRVLSGENLRGAGLM